MRALGVEVERPVVPTSLSISEDETELAGRDSYPVSVVLKRLDAKDGDETETVKAKYVVGTSIKSFSLL